MYTLRKSGGGGREACTNRCLVVEGGHGLTPAWSDPPTRRRLPAHPHDPATPPDPSQMAPAQLHDREIGLPDSQLRTRSSRLAAPHSQLQTRSSALAAPLSQLRTRSSRLAAPHSQLRTRSSRLVAPDTRPQ